MSYDPRYSAFALKARAGWMHAVDRIMPPGSDTRSWSNPGEMMSVLDRLVGSTFSRALLPTGGTIDIDSASYSGEAGCVEFRSGNGSVVVHPASLTLERIACNPAESFALLDLCNLQPTGVYADNRNQHIAKLRCEEVVNLGNAEYVSRDGRDDGVYDDEFADEHELPDNYRAVSRFLNGKLMLVAKGSIWSQNSRLHDGFHEKMNVQSIRNVCERIVR